MDSISDSDSEDAGSIPAGVTLVIGFSDQENPYEIKSRRVKNSNLTKVIGLCNLCHRHSHTNVGHLWRLQEKKQVLFLT